MGLFPEFSKFFVSYGQYHNDTTNKLIHVVCIPLLVFSLQNILQGTSWSMNFDGSDKQGLFTVNIPFVLTCLISFLYMNVDLVSGIISTMVYMSFCLWGRSMYLDALQNETTSEFAKWNWIVQALAWSAQFIGHGVFEGRKPALVDNLLLTLVAPNFVTIEILFALGWRKEMHKKCQEEIDNILLARSKHYATKLD